MRTNIRCLLEEEGAVSPVIGVILMVAITVILAAVIGTFVLGLGGQVSQTAPQASITVQQVSTNGTDAGQGEYMVLKHGGSDSIAFENTNIKVQVAGTSVGTLSAGDGIESPKFTTADTLNITSTGSSETAAYLNGDIGSGTQAYTTNIGSALNIDDGDSYTVTMIDNPSGQVISEKSGTA